MDKCEPTFVSCRDLVFFRANLSRSNVAGFLAKAYQIFDNPAWLDICGWGNDGQTVIIRKQVEFAQRILPLFFNHSNLQSFVRQVTTCTTVYFSIVRLGNTINSITVADCGYYLLWRSRLSMSQAPLECNVRSECLIRLVLHYTVASLDSCIAW